ncbi:MAG: hypothetical protein COW63_05550 [Bacteroidetes bacterium CG18_big_fil_WC_8_21_14_2_50_41_14]|nr:MAG: hypothetical protein COW63_05550 [Bacteroidetes bacterium CG18_big_fil_WC_8_21_14_2_50_41_14]PJB58807.1 MAG: hypothetical protein CO098_06765 [Bacteroidetes bacterium CG_4_9_14_3_um_filter_41_19]
MHRGLFLVAVMSWYSLTLSYAQIHNEIKSSTRLSQDLSTIDDSIQAKKIFEIAHSYFTSANYDSAFSNFEEVLMYYKKLNKWETQADIYSYLSGISWKFRDLKNASLYNDSALRLLHNAHADSLHVQYAKAYHNYGTIELLKGNLQEAVIQLEKAININEQTTDDSDARLLNNYNNIGVAYSYMNSSTMAIRYAQKSLDLVLRTDPDNAFSIGRAYQNLGVAYVKDFNYEKALEYYQKALDEYEKVLSEPHLNFAQMYQNMASIATNDSAFEKAIEYNKRAMYNYGGNTNNPHPESYRLYHNNATIYKMMGNYDKALQLEKKSIPLYEAKYGSKHPEIANDYQYLGRIYHAKGEYDSSLMCLQKSIIANIVQFNDTSITATPVLEGIFSNYYLGISFVWKATVLFERFKESGQINDLDLALENYKLFSCVIDLQINEYKEEDAIIALYRDYLTTYEEAILFCNQAYEITKDEKFLNEAFLFSEKTNAQILKAALNADKAQLFADIPEDIIQEDSRLREELLSRENSYKTIVTTLPLDSALANTYLNDTLFHAKRALELFTKNLEKNYSNYYQLKYSQNLPTIQEIQHSLLQEEDALVEYYLGDTSLFVFTITKESMAMERLPVDLSLLTIVDDFRKSTGNYSFIQGNSDVASAMYIHSANRLYNELFPQKCRNLIQNKSNLIIIPDGMLCYIPFEALRADDSENQTPSPDTYLVNDFSITYMYSASMLSKAIKHQKANSLYAGFAPSYDALLLASANELDEFETFRSSPVSLTENIFEVEQAGNFLDGDTYIGSQANEAAFKKTANEYKILHLAMHALINDKNPLSSTLIFTNTGDSVEDGYLHTYEIYNMKLNADLAVLSACNTADGVLQSGEGVMSLSRAFMFAGVKNIISTLWPANDATSSQLMEIFFKNIKEGIPLATALKNAKITFLKTTDPAHASPYYWANFILVGNNEPILLNQHSLWKTYGYWILAGLVLSLSIVWLIKKL